MNADPSTIALFALAAALPLAVQAWHASPRWLSALLLVACGSVPVAAGFLAARWEERLKRQAPVAETAIQSRPRQLTGDGYVQSSACRSCHPSQYASWHSSYHRTMTQVASKKSVLGDFDELQMQNGGRNYRLTNEPSGYFANIVQLGPDDASPPPADAAHYRGKVVMTTGSHHMQAYWYESGSGRLLVQLPFIWLRPEKQWIPEAYSFLKPYAPHGDDSLASWNVTCVRCHTTQGCQGGEAVDATLDTHAVEFGISCEACHGPGKDHVQANADPRRRYQLHLSGGADSTIQNPGRMSTRRGSDVCGQCHSANLYNSPTLARLANVNGPKYRPGDDLAEERLAVQPSAHGDHPLLRRLLASKPDFVDTRFWSDGVCRVSGGEFNGMIDSPCYQRGEMSCMSCHQMHRSDRDERPLEEWTDDQLAPGMRGNEACLQCHAHVGKNLVAHTHHPPDSDGSLCYNCHMPYTSWGLLKGIRSHTVSSPSVAASQRTGRPNACNQCHLDKTLHWTASQLESWYGTAPPELAADERETAASVLWTLAGDAGQRALMAWSFGWKSAMEASGDSWQIPYLAQLLDDPYPAVRIAAKRSLVRYPGYESFEYDLVGDETYREAALDRALAQWRSRERGDESVDPGSVDRGPVDPGSVDRGPVDRGPVDPGHVLLDAGGALDEKRFQNLLRRRNQRTVHLEE